MRIEVGHWVNIEALYAGNDECYGKKRCGPASEAGRDGRGCSHIHHKDEGGNEHAVGNVQSALTVADRTAPKCDDEARDEQNGPMPPPCEQSEAASDDKERRIEN